MAHDPSWCYLLGGKCRHPRGSVACDVEVGLMLPDDDDLEDRECPWRHTDRDIVAALPSQQTPRASIKLSATWGIEA